MQYIQLAQDGNVKCWAYKMSFLGCSRKIRNYRTLLLIIGVWAKTCAQGSRGKVPGRQLIRHTEFALVCNSF